MDILRYEIIPSLITSKKEWSHFATDGVINEHTVNVENINDFVLLCLNTG